MTVVIFEKDTGLNSHSEKTKRNAENLKMKPFRVLCRSRQIPT